jgi:hypothetical protein
MTYQFDAEIAAKYGVDEAIMIFNLSYWIRKNEANGKHYHDGRFWTYNSIDAFTKLFPFWSARQIRRILKSLEDSGIIVTGNYNTSTYDRTTWYAFGDSFLPKGQMHLTETSNGSDQNVESYNNQGTDIKPNDKPNEAADSGLFPDTEDNNGFVPVTITRPRRTSEPICLFEDSRYFDVDKFVAEFTAPEYRQIDIVYYHGVCMDWSSSIGAKKRDWIATARNMMRSDKEKGKLHLIGANNTGLDADTIEYLKSMAD